VIDKTITGMDETTTRIAYETITGVDETTKSTKYCQKPNEK